MLQEPQTDNPQAHHSPTKQFSTSSIIQVEFFQWSIFLLIFKIQNKLSQLNCFKFTLIIQV